MRRALLLVSLLVLGGCTSFAPKTIAGGGCEREVTYGFKFNAMNIILGFDIYAVCVDNSEEEPANSA